MSMIRREGILAIALLFVVLGAYWSTLVAFHARWASMELGYSHGYPVLAIMLYVIYERRDYLQQLRIRRFLPALPILGLLALAWLFANAIQVQVIQQLVLPAIVLAWVGAVFGWRIGLALLVPFLLLYLAVPVWDVLVNPLRLLTVAVVQAWLELGNYTAYVDGFYITVPAGKFRVAGGCSGLNYFLTALTLAVVYVVLYIRHPGRRVVFASICVLTALVVNWLRVFLLVLIGYHTDMQSSLIADHGTFGWVLFALALVPLFWFGARLEDAPQPAAASDTVSDPAASTVSLRIAVLATVLGISGPVIAWAVDRQASAGRFELPLQQLDGFYPTDSADAPWGLQYRGFDRASAWRYSEGDAIVQLRVLYYDTQRQGKELVSDLNRIAPERDVRDSSPVTVNGAYLPLQEAVIVDGGMRRLLWWSYFVAGQLHASSGDAKLAQLKGLLRGDFGAALVVFQISCGSANARCDRARDTLSDIVPDVIAAIEASDAAPAGESGREL